MKKIISTFLVSIFGGLLALTIHNYFYDHEVNYENKEKDIESPTEKKDDLGDTHSEVN